MSFPNPDDNRYIVHLNEYEHGLVENNFQMALEDQETMCSETAEHASEWYGSLWSAHSFSQLVLESLVLRTGKRPGPDRTTTNQDSDRQRPNSRSWSVLVLVFVFLSNGETDQRPV